MTAKRPTEKRSIETVRSELRAINAASNDITVDIGNWRTPEFWTMAAAAVANLLTVAVLVGWLNQSDAEAVSKAVTSLVAATQVIILNTVLVWKYIASRNELRISMYRANCEYMMQTFNASTQHQLSQW